MNEIIHSFFYIVDEWTDQQYINDPETKELLDRQDALQEEIILRLGADGRELIEKLAELRLQLENIHNEALFRAAMQLGTQIAQPGGVYSTSR